MDKSVLNLWAKIFLSQYECVYGRHYDWHIGTQPPFSVWSGKKWWIVGSCVYSDT